MPGPAAAVAGGVGLVGNIMGSRAQSRAAGQATDAQLEAQRMALEEQARQFDASQKILAPWQQAGLAALGDPTPSGLMTDWKAGYEKLQNAMPQMPKKASLRETVGEDPRLTMPEVYVPPKPFFNRPAKGHKGTGAIARAKEHEVKMAQYETALRNKKRRDEAIKKYDASVKEYEAGGKDYQRQMDTYKKDLKTWEKEVQQYEATKPSAQGAPAGFRTPPGKTVQQPAFPAQDVRDGGLIKKGPPTTQPMQGNVYQAMFEQMGGGGALRVPAGNKYFPQGAPQPQQMGGGLPPQRAGTQEYLGQRATDSILDQNIQEFRTPETYAGSARAGLAATPWLQEYAQLGLRQADQLGQYADVGATELANVQGMAREARGAGGLLEGYEQAGLGQLEDLKASGAAGAGARAGLQGFQQFGQESLGGLRGYTDRGAQSDIALGDIQQAGLGQLSGIGQYAGTGTQALQQQRAISGLEGAQAQQQAIAGLESSPEFQAMMKQGEEAILQNAAATGGLRGGRTQEALADLRQNLLAQQIDKQYGRMGQMAGQGLGAAQGLAGMGQQAAGQRAGQGLGAGQFTAGLGQGSAGQLMGQAGQDARFLAGMGQGALQSRYQTGVGLTQNLMGQGLGTSQFLTGQGGGVGQFLAGGGQQAIGNIAGFGQAAAARQAANAMQQGTNAANIAMAGGQARAQGALAQGAAQAGMWGGLGNMAGTLGGMYMMKDMYGGAGGSPFAGTQFGGGGYGAYS